MTFVTPKLVERGNTIIVQHGTDESSFAEFSMMAIKNEYKSQQEGMPVFDNVEWVEVTFPGDRTKVISRKAKIEDKERWARAYQRFLNQEAQTAEGMPLEEWSPMTKADVASFKANKIYSLQQLAALPDTALSWLGARVWRDKAKAWLAQATDGKAVLALQAKNVELQEQVESLTRQFKDLSDSVKKAEKPKKLQPSEQQEN